MIRPFRT